MGLADSLFVAANEIAERTVKLADGTEHVLHFRQLENSAFERYALQRSSADVDVAAMAPTNLLVLGVVNPDGTPALTLDKAKLLKRKVHQALFDALLEVNGYGKEAQAATKKD